MKLTDDERANLLAAAERACSQSLAQESFTINSSPAAGAPFALPAKPDRSERAFRAYVERFRHLAPMDGFTVASRRKAARACRKAVERGQPFTWRELLKLEPKRTPGVKFYRSL